MTNALYKIGGYRVIQNPLLPKATPKIQIRHDVPMTDEGRAKANAFLADFFGYTENVIIFGDAVVTHPDTFSKFEQAASNKLRRAIGELFGDMSKA